MNKTEFKYDKDGNLIAYRDGKPVGRVVGMGDLIGKEHEDDLEKKIQGLDKMRRENAEYWADYMENGGKMTPEKIKEMREDNEKLKKIAKEVTREWLEEE